METFSACRPNHCDAIVSVRRRRAAAGGVLHKHAALGRGRGDSAGGVGHSSAVLPVSRLREISGPKHRCVLFPLRCQNSMNNNLEHAMRGVAPFASICVRRWDHVERFTAYRLKNRIWNVCSRSGTGSGGRYGGSDCIDRDRGIAGDSGTDYPFRVLPLPPLRKIPGPQYRRILSLLRQKNGINRCFDLQQEVASCGMNRRARSEK